MKQMVYFVGTPETVAHRAAPLQEIDYQIMPPEQVINIAKPADLVIFYSEHFDDCREACRQLKKNNVATLYMIDGILEWRNAWENRENEPACPWTMRPVLSHKVACIGPSQARVLHAWGNADKIEIVGVPRFDDLQKSSRQSKPDEFTLLVMTAKWPGFTQTQIDNTVRSLQDIKAWVAANPTIDGRHVKIKWRLTQDLPQQLGVENQIDDFTGRDLANRLRTVDAVITTPSTAMLEAMLAGIPVATIDYNNCPKYVPAAWQISAASQIDDVIRKLAQPAEAKRFFQQAILADALADQNAGRRMTTLIREMLRIAAEKTTRSEPLVFPPNLAGFEPNDDFPDFDHAKIFAKSGEFKGDNALQLQSELGHARREIKHLNGEIAQLKSELQQAHEIFDQINQHPIAGPVVRVRQKLLDWFARFADRKQSNIKSTRIKNGSRPTS